MKRRRLLAVGALLLVVPLLTSCTVAQEWAIRLNADHTVDFLLCDGSLSEIDVDYQSEAEWNSYSYQSVADWYAAPDGFDDVSNIDVAHYGEVPTHWTETAPAPEPPVDWFAVDVGVGSMLRSDLREGEWIWNTRDQWAWIPPHPCDGWRIAPDGEPERI